MKLGGVGGGGERGILWYSEESGSVRLQSYNFEEKLFTSWPAKQLAP